MLYLDRVVFIKRTVKREFPTMPCGLISTSRKG